MSVKVFQGRVYEDGSATILARITAGTGSTTGIAGEGYPVIQADLSTITYSIYDLETGSFVVNSSSLTIANVIYDTLQDTDGILWAQDGIGYNFRHNLGSASFPDGDRRYRYEAKFTSMSGDVFWLLLDLTAENVRTS